MKRKISLFLLLSILLALLIVPVSAEAQLNYVTDEAGLLTDEQWLELEMLCEEISQTYHCGVYMVTVEDYQDYGTGDVFEVTYGIYHDYELGMGAGRDGLILLLSMKERDFALFVYGDQAHYAFDEFGQLWLEDSFLPQFGEDDWYGGFRSYAETCRWYLESAAAGEPVRASNGIVYVLCIAASFLVALIVVLIMRSGMKNVQKATQANNYLSADLELTKNTDRYINTTRSRRKIETESSQSEARSGGGGSGRSGKF